MSDSKQDIKQKSEEDTKTEDKIDIEKLKKERQKMEEKAKEVILEFLKDNGNGIVETTIQYTKQCGLGALFVTLVPNSDEADIEYFKVEDLDGGFKKKILENPNKDTSIFYAIKLSYFSYIFERNLGEKVEDYVV